MRLSIFALLIVVTMAFVPAASASTIDAAITADNHYGFYTGNASGSVLHFYGANESGSGGSPGTYNWSSPESYSVTTDDQVIYVAAWSDDSSAQGLLASFMIDGNPLLSGDASWQVFATYVNLNDGDPPPAIADLSTQIGLANSLAGWEAIAVNDINGVDPWGFVGGISADARWMWGQDKAGIGSPFDPGADHGEYLIFRTVVPEPNTLVVLLLPALSLLVRGRARKPIR
jgi:hypothetical protein